MLEDLIKPLYENKIYYIVGVSILLVTAIICFIGRIILYKVKHKK